MDDSEARIGRRLGASETSGEKTRANI